MRLSLQQLQRKTALAPLQQRFLLELVGAQPRADEPLAAAHVLLFWLAEMLQRQQIGGEMAWQLLLRRLAPYIEKVAPVIERRLAGEPYPAGWEHPQLVLIDGRWAVWPGAAGVLDLETGDNAEEAPPPVVTVAYHLDTLAARMGAIHAQREARRVRQRGEFASGAASDSVD